MKALDDRTMANLDVALEEACRSLPHGGDHEIRKEIAQKLLDSAAHGNKTLSGLTEVARAALAEAIKKSAKLRDSVDAPPPDQRARSGAALPARMLWTSHRSRVKGRPEIGTAGPSQS